MGKKSIFIILCSYFLISIYCCSSFYNEQLAHIYPITPKKDISELTLKGTFNFSNEEYDLIFQQTGLGKTAVLSLNNSSQLLEFQKNYYADINFECIRNSPISCEDYVAQPTLKLADVEDGDILITNSSHIFSWRNGHAAIVIDAEKGETVEAVVIGTNSSIQNLSKWEHYPNIRILRLKNATKEERHNIAQAAKNNLINMPYNALIGIFPRKYSKIDELKGTQCAHLVWSAYASFGYDIDSDKGLIVTPRDISQSNLFETIQIYGAV